MDQSIQQKGEKMTEQGRQSEAVTLALGGDQTKDPDSA
jgi:hypothetical protein